MNEDLNEYEAELTFETEYALPHTAGMDFWGEGIRFGRLGARRYVWTVGIAAQDADTALGAVRAKIERIVEHANQITPPRILVASVRLA